MEVNTTVPATTAHIGTHGHDGHGRHWDEQVAVGFTADALAAAKTDNAIAAAGQEEQEDAKDVQLAIAASATQTLVGFKDLTALSYQIQGASLLEAAKNAAALQVQATANANAAAIQATSNFNMLNIEAVKNASAAELRAQQIAATAAAQAAECCCELKALITAQGEQTRGLITQGTIDSLRAQLASIPRGIAVTLPVGVG